jgi:hypothetical protein
MIINKKQDEEGILFIMSNVIFKVSIGLFIIFFFLFHEVSEIDKMNKIIIGFAGVILLYDAIYIDLPRALKIYNIHFSPYTLLKKLV